METQRAIVWSFDSAPKELKDLSVAGGDEDWIVEIPVELYCSQYAHWMDSIDTCFNPEKHTHPSMPGWLVLIGAHS
jgi:hypothetical protein